MALHTTSKRNTGKVEKATLNETLVPVLALRDAVYFPGTLNILHVARDASLRALKRALDDGRKVLVLSQQDMAVEDPMPTDLHLMGTICEALQAIPLPDSTMRASLRGLSRARARSIVAKDGALYAEVEYPQEEQHSGSESEALVRHCLALFSNVVQLSTTIPPEAAQAVAHIAEPGILADNIAHHMPLKPFQKQALLETLDVQARLNTLVSLLKHEEEVLQLGRSIQKRVEAELTETQREFYLREQLRAIEAELQIRENRIGETEEYGLRIAKAEMPAAAREKAELELRRLDRSPSASPEGLVIRNYLDSLIALPWNQSTEDRLDVKAASLLLEAQHFGLKRVKERILEHLAVRQLKNTLRGPILCFVGPPGVGKTSLAKSIAEAMGRKYVRIALGGLRDEAEIRGHRRTYVGSMPGRIIESLIQCGSRNPVILLDEIDKVGPDGRGDATSALLEVLDPEQNDAFVDHYVEAPFDLSSVLFVATANSLDEVSPALRDRMEIVPFSGYTDAEKDSIATQFIVPASITEHGLNRKQFTLQPAALKLLISDYTREAGARALARNVDALTRKAARLVAEGMAKSVSVTPEKLRDMLGPATYPRRATGGVTEAGLSWGLVVSIAGGDVIPIEVSLTPPIGESPTLMLTGNLGSVMKESAQAAVTYLRAHFPGAQQRLDVHIHVPEGAIPKDGPSGGVAIALALASAFFDRPLPTGLAFTGEISLRGRVLGVGGIREKLLAAVRAGFSEVMIPKENESDLEDLPADAQQQLKITLISDLQEALERAGFLSPQS